MMVTNKKDVSDWLDHLWANGFVYRRYPVFDLADIQMDWQGELEKHARLYLDSPRHFTFHHIRSLMKELKQNSIRHPLVGTILNGQIQVNPGGSRLMVAKKLGIPHSPLDLIQPKDFHVDFTAKDFINVTTIDQMLQAFEDLDFECCVDVHPDKMYYEIHMPQFHWARDDIDEWLEQNGSRTCKNYTDYYFL